MVEAEPVTQTYVEPDWEPIHKRAGDYTVEELKRELKLLKGMLKPAVHHLIFSSFRSADSTLCVIDGQDCRLLLPQYIKMGVADHVGYKPRRFVTWGGLMNGTYCPGHLRMELHRQELEKKRIQDKRQPKALKKGEDKKGLVTSPIEYFRPKDDVMVDPLSAKYGPILAEMEKDGFQISSYMSPSDFACPKCGFVIQTKSQPDLTLIVADRRKMLGTVGMQLPEELVEKEV